MAQSTAWYHAHRGTHKQYALMTHPNPRKHMVHAAVLTHSKPVPITVVRPVNVVMPKLKVTRPRYVKPIFTKINSPTRRQLTRSPSPKVSNSPPRVTAVKAPVGTCPIYLILRSSMVDMLPLEVTQRVVKLLEKGKIRTGKLDFDDVYFIKELKFNLFSVSQMCDKKNSVLFTDTACLVLSPDFKLPDNTDRDAVFDGKKPKFDEKKLESEVNVSPRNSAQSRKQDDNTKKEAKGKSHVESFTGYRDLSAKFKDYSDNSINEVNVTESEDITYSDDEDDVGAEADFNNLETSITVSPAPTTRVHKDHSVTQIISDLSSTTQTRSMTRVAKDQEEPKRVHQALKDPSWIEAMQEELLQFKMQKEEGIDYEEVFAPVGRIEAIRLFLAYASFMGFMVYQMDVKSAFLYGTIEEEVYVCQPPGFKDPDHPAKVYKVVKALYGLHQAPRAWYETLANYLLENGFQRGKIDQTLFIKTQKGDILLVQIYVDDIIFGATNKDLCKSFEKLMKDKFQMSSIGVLTFFLEGKSASTLIDTKKPLLKDLDGEDVDVHTYRSMIGSLMYLTSSRPDIMFAIDLLAMQETNNSEAEYVAAASCCAQVLWIQNQLLDYGSIKYALTVNPNIYVSCIKQFWTTVAVKKVNDVIRLQALADKKKVVVTEATIREALHFDGAEGVKCLPNEEIFSELARMGYEKPSTKLTSSMASAVICLSSGRKFNFSKYIFDSLLRNVDSPSKFYMYPRFLQLMIRKQVAQEVVAKGDAEVHGEEVNASDAAKGDVTAAHREVQPTPPQSPQRVKKLERKNKVRVLKLIRLQKVGTAQRVETSDETVKDDVSNQGRMIAEMDQDVDVVLEEAKKVAKDAKVDESVDIQGRQSESNAKIYKIDLDHVNKVLSMQEDESKPAEVQEVVDVVITAKIITEVVTAASETITPAEAQVLAATLTVAPARVTAAPSRRRKGVVIRDLQKESTTSTIIPAETRIKYQALKRKPQTEAQAKKNMMLYLKNVVSFKMDYFKGMSYDDIRPIFEAKFNSNVAFLLKTNEQIKEEESRALKRLNETPAEKAAKRRKLDEEVEEIKRHLQIVPNEDDDVYTEVTPLARKVPVVDYQIIELNNKPYYKIIRADDTHQLYVSFLSLLRNFDREDLEALWSLVKERFSTTKPKNFFDDFLLLHLEKCLRNQIFMLKSRKIKELFMVQQRLRDGNYWNHVVCKHNIYNHPADFVSREEVPTHKIHSRSDAECCKT
nr:hypothetical protein [Tanacetum cinerariifolium]